MNTNDQDEIVSHGTSEDEDDDEFTAALSLAATKLAVICAVIALLAIMVIVTLTSP